MKPIAFGVAVIGLVHALTGCGSSSVPSSPSSVTAPRPQPPTPPPGSSNGLATFTDPRSGFSTSDLHDVQEQVVRVNLANELIWVEDGTHLPGYRAQQNSIPAEMACACWLIVRFGIRNGERRAYLTADYGHDNPGTLVDLGIAGAALTVTRTTLFAPGTFTMSGVITEPSEDGPLPVADAMVTRVNEEGSGWQSGATDRNGFYEVHGLYDGARDVAVIKNGYVSTQSTVVINGDTRFDGQIVRR